MLKNAGAFFSNHQIRPEGQMQFREGDKVRWASQAHGGVREKVGVVAEVVQAGNRPTRERFVSLYKHAGCGYGRDHESYVVVVGKKPYWPRVTHLQPAE